MPPFKTRGAWLGAVGLMLLTHGCGSTTVPDVDDDMSNQESGDGDSNGDGDSSGDGDGDNGDGDSGDGDSGDGDSGDGDSGDGDSGDGDVGDGDVGDGDVGDGDVGDGDTGQPDAGTDPQEPTDGRELCPGGAEPPEYWMEHWFEHDRNMKRVFYDDCAAIYFDEDMDLAQAEWIFDFVGDLWAYSLKTYGFMGPERVYASFHQGRYFGGHPAYWFDDFHDYRNHSDAGGNDWSYGNFDLTSHEIGHIVESTAAHTKYGSPAFGLWGDSKWMEFYQYDAYVGMGMDEHAQVVFDRFTNTSDDFPRAGTHWFRDWFYPLWRDHGHAKVMVNFFSLLEQHFPAGGDKRMRGMNWGEYIHFTSGAAGKNLKELATNAFGWPADWEAQFTQAQKDFPGITY